MRIMFQVIVFSYVKATESAFIALDQRDFGQFVVNGQQKEMLSSTLLEVVNEHVGSLLRGKQVNSSDCIITLGMLNTVSHSVGWNNGIELLSSIPTRREYHWFVLEQCCCKQLLSSLTWPGQDGRADFHLNFFIPALQPEEIYKSMFSAKFHEK